MEHPHQNLHLLGSFQHSAVVFIDYRIKNNISFLATIFIFIFYNWTTYLAWLRLIYSWNFLATRLFFLSEKNWLTSLDFLSSCQEWLADISLLDFLSSCQELADKSPCQEKLADNLMHFKQDFWKERQLRTIRKQSYTYN